MKYTKSQVLECAECYDAMGEPVGASMLRAFAQTLGEPVAVPDGDGKFDAWWERNGDGSIYGRGIAMDAWTEMSRRNKSALDFKQLVIDQAMARINELERNTVLALPISYFAADPSEGEFQTFATLEQAKDRAEHLLVWASDEAFDSGWSDDPPQICYGIVLARCEEDPGSRKPAPEGSEFTEMVNFRLSEPLPAASHHPTTEKGCSHG